MKKKKKPQFTDKSDIRLGFEVECCIFKKYKKRFYEDIRKLKGVSTGGDGSIDYNGYEEFSVEIRTSPLPPKKAMKCLETVFEIVNKYGTTNESCGLHVNISSAKKIKMKSFNPIPFLASRIWNQILKKFKRIDNEYCCHFNVGGKSNVDILKSLTYDNHDYDCDNVLDNKYRCVNFSNWGKSITKYSRVEIRGFGNQDYTKKYDDVSGFVNRIVKLFNLSCDKTPWKLAFKV